MRLLAGAQIDAADACRRGGSRLGAGDRRPLAGRDPEGAAQPGGTGAIDPGEALQGTLRPYQQVGVRWLYLLAKLGLGACLADDMGLGKTIQVLSLLLVLKKRRPAASPACWWRRLRCWPTGPRRSERFAPSLKVLIAHPSAIAGEELKTTAADALAVWIW